MAKHHRTIRYPPADTHTVLWLTSRCQSSEGGKTSCDAALAAGELAIPTSSSSK